MSVTSQAANCNTHMKMKKDSDVKGILDSKNSNLKGALDFKHRGDKQKSNNMPMSGSIDMQKDVIARRPMLNANPLQTEKEKGDSKQLSDKTMKKLLSKALTVSRNPESFEEKYKEIIEILSQNRGWFTIHNKEVPSQKLIDFIEKNDQRLKGFGFFGELLTEYDRDFFSALRENHNITKLTRRTKISINPLENFLAIMTSLGSLQQFQFDFEYDADNADNPLPENKTNMDDQILSAQGLKWKEFFSLSTIHTLAIRFFEPPHNEQPDNFEQQSKILGWLLDLLQPLLGKISTLQIYNTRLTSHLDKLLRSLKHNQNLTTLDLTNCSLNEAAGNQIASFLYDRNKKNNNTLSLLKLCDNPLKDSAAAIIKASADHENLSLDLRSCSIDNAHANFVKNALQENTVLRELLLTGNTFDGGVVFQNLRSPQHLLKLNLEMRWHKKNFLPLPMFDFFTYNTNLTELDISSVLRLGDEFHLTPHYPIFEALSQNPFCALQFLRLNNFLYKPSDGRYIARWLENNKTLTTFQSTVNPRDPNIAYPYCFYDFAETFPDILESLKANHTLSDFWMTDMLANKDFFYHIEYNPNKVVLNPCHYNELREIDKICRRNARRAAQKQAVWSTVALYISFRRANSNSDLKDSIIPLMGIIKNFAEISAHSTHLQESIFPVSHVAALFMQTPILEAFMLYNSGWLLFDALTLNVSDPDADSRLALNIGLLTLQCLCLHSDFVMEPPYFNFHQFFMAKVIHTANMLAMCWKQVSTNLSYYLYPRSITNHCFYYGNQLKQTLSNMMSYSVCSRNRKHEANLRLKHLSRLYENQREIERQTISESTVVLDTKSNITQKNKYDDDISGLHKRTRNDEKMISDSKGNRTPLIAYAYQYKSRSMHQPLEPENSSSSATPAKPESRRCCVIL